MVERSGNKRRSLTVYFCTGMLLVTACAGKRYRADGENRMLVKSVLLNCNECGFETGYSISRIDTLTFVPAYNGYLRCSEGIIARDGEMEIPIYVFKNQSGRLISVYAHTDEERYDNWYSGSINVKGIDYRNSFTFERNMNYLYQYLLDEKAAEPKEEILNILLIGMGMRKVNKYYIDFETEQVTSLGIEDQKKEVIRKQFFGMKEELDTSDSVFFFEAKRGRYGFWRIEFLPEGNLKMDLLSGDTFSIMRW